MDWDLAVLDTINSTANATSYDTGTVALVNGHTYAFGIVNSKATLPDAPTSVQTVGGAQVFTAKGTALLWDTIGTPLKRSRWWLLKCTGDVSAAVRVDFGANTQTGLRGVLVDITNETDTDPYVAEKQASVDNDTTLSCTPDAARNTDSLFLAMGINNLNNNADVVSGTDWTGLGAGLANVTPNFTLELAYNESGVAQTVTFNTAGSAARAIHVVEIGAAIADEDNLPLLQAIGEA